VTSPRLQTGQMPSIWVYLFIYTHARISSCTKGLTRSSYLSPRKLLIVEISWKWEWKWKWDWKRNRAWHEAAHTHFAKWCQIFTWYYISIFYLPLTSSLLTGYSCSKSSFIFCIFFFGNNLLRNQDLKNLHM